MVGSMTERRRRGVLACELQRFEEVVGKMDRFPGRSAIGPIFAL
jgi:hypothetical protein